jgi:hypothetical protein
MTQTNLPVATVFLVHAAWADASSWNKIIPPPQRRAPLASAPDGVVAIITQAVHAVLHEAVPDPQRIGRRA